MTSSDMKPTEGGHSPWRMILIILHVPVFAATMTFNYLSTPAAAGSGLFLSDTGTISDKYDTAVTPAGWTFTIWAFIYVWQIIHVIYSLTLLCRKTPEGNYLYVSPGHLHFSFYVVYIINLGLNTGWIFLFDREELIAAFVFLFFIALTIYISGFLICKYLDQAGAQLEKMGNAKDIWFTRIFHLNGLAFYGTWCSIATLLNLAIVLQHIAGIERTICAWIALIILTIELATWFVLETFIFDRYLRYCASPYIVLLVAFSGVLSKNYRPDYPESHLYYTMALMGLSGVLAIVKVVIMIVKGCRQPIDYGYTSDVHSKEIDAQNTHL